MQDIFREEKRAGADGKLISGAAEEGKDIRVSLTFDRAFGVSDAELLIRRDGGNEESFPLEWESFVLGRDIWSVLIPAERLSAGLWFYRYVITAGGKKRSFGGEGEEILTENADRQLLIYDKSLHVPEKLKGAVIYHIFVDRFRRSGKCGVKDGAVLDPDWNGGIPQYGEYPGADVKNNVFFGGDLWGIAEKLDYIKALGTDYIYLSPVFDAYSNHKYDTGDYMTVDPMFGGDEALFNLIAEAGKIGIGIILDGVFNHTGRKSVYFNADGFYPGLGAAQGEQSPYYRWYNFHPFPDEYDAWWGIKNLPAVNELEKSYVDYIIEGEHSIIKRWLRAGASGWRLDVADELPDVFIEKIRAAMNEVCPDSYLLGEVWEDGTTKIAYSQRRRYLLGRETNGLMNYPFRTALMAFLLGGGAEYFRDSMEQLRENYPAPAFYGAMNFLSTHDTPRLLTILGLSAPAPQTRDERAVYRLSEEELAHGKALLKLASLILYTFPGSPMLYYGDEAGMQGFEDPFNRGTYPWGHEDEELLRCFRQLGALRRAHEALQSGTIVYHAAQGRVLAFSRRAAHDHCLTVVNAGEEVVTLTLPWDAALAEDALSHQAFFCGDGMLRLTLEPYGAMLLTEPQD